ncbi:MAG: hypothetical protein EOP51_02415 [Sphingobacteriales bacterium]|nr:MAG: hypothetical protein EOP51_02415 [Sphingobacteriales bacterium]
MKLSAKLTGLFTLMILVPAISFAHGNSGGVPLDGGISLLVAAGVGYGAKKMAASRKKNNNTEPTEQK